jgi:hypothetical protein
LNMRLVETMRHPKEGVNIFEFVCAARIHVSAASILSYSHVILAARLIDEG